MITGVHALIYSSQPDAVRAFLRDTLGLDSVDAGGGWPIFTLPPAELAVHPAEGPGDQELWLMCDDLDGTIVELSEKGIAVGPITDERWGRATTIRLSQGDELGLYQPAHPTAIKPSG